MKIFITGFTQVFLITIQTYFISKVFYPGVLIVGFLISFIWTWNVKKLSVGTMPDRIKYSSGAAVGATIGLLLSTLIYKAI